MDIRAACRIMDNKDMPRAKLFMYRTTTCGVINRHTDRVGAQICTGGYEHQCVARGVPMVCTVVEFPVYAIINAIEGPIDKYCITQAVMGGVGRKYGIAIHYNLTCEVANSRTDIVSIRHTPTDAIDMRNHAPGTLNTVNCMTNFTASVGILRICWNCCKI